MYIGSFMIGVMPLYWIDDMTMLDELDDDDDCNEGDEEEESKANDNKRSKDKLNEITFISSMRSNASFFSATLKVRLIFI